MIDIEKIEAINITKEEISLEFEYYDDGFYDYCSIRRWFFECQLALGHALLANAKKQLYLLHFSHKNK